MKYWAFDLDGTLVDSFEHFFIFMREVFNEHSVAFTPDMQLTALTQSLPVFFQTHLGQDAVAPTMKRLHERSNEDAKIIKPFPGALALIERIREQGGRIAIWTNRDLTSASLILENSGLGQHIDLCVSGGCTQLRKPHPEGLQRIIDTFQCTPDQITMIGDHEYDVQAAKTVGARAVRASWHGYWTFNPCSISDHQFHQFEEFSHWVSHEKSSHT